MAGTSLPEPVERVLGEVVAAARERLGPDLRSVVLFGSGAEGRLRPTSDLNVMFVLARFDSQRVAALAPALRTARATVRLEPMFVLEDEVPSAASAFAVKFLDVSRRHRVLHGPDPFERLRVDRERLRSRVEQVLLNLAMRLRARLATDADREEALAAALADAVGPVRTAAAALLELAGETPPPPREALLRWAQRWGEPADPALLESLSTLHREGRLPPGAIAPRFAAAIGLVERMRAGGLATPAA